MNIYQYADKTTPTTRIKTDEEIEKDKLKKLEKLRQKEEEESVEEEPEEKPEENDDNKKLTKKERIGKLIEKRLMKAEALRLKSKDDSNLKVSSKKNEEDGMSDLDEGEEGEEGQEEGQGQEGKERQEVIYSFFSTSLPGHSL